MGYALRKAAPRNAKRGSLRFMCRPAVATSPDGRCQQAGGEPPLAEVLADPIVHLVMRRDGVALDQLLAVIGRARRGLHPQPDAARPILAAVKKEFLP